MSKKGEAVNLITIIDNDDNNEQKEITIRQTALCFDFDETIVNAHYHNILKGKKIASITSDPGLIINGELTESMHKNLDYNPDLVISATAELLADPSTGLRNPEKLKQIIEKLINAGHKIAITTFSLYHDCVKYTLSTFLNEDIANQIHIISGFPTMGSTDPNGKWLHISKVMELSSIEDPTSCMLIDDSLSNILSAKNHSVFTTIVPEHSYQSNEYLDEVFEKAEKLKLGTLRDSAKVAMEEYERFRNPLSIQANYTDSDSSDSGSSNDLNLDQYNATPPISILKESTIDIPQKIFTQILNGDYNENNQCISDELIGKLEKLRLQMLNSSSDSELSDFSQDSTRTIPKNLTQEQSKTTPINLTAFESSSSSESWEGWNCSYPSLSGTTTDEDLHL